MPADKKIKRETDKKYLAYIRSQACFIGILCCGKVDAHHEPSVGAGGSDYCALPLCRKHHSEAHQTGKKTFQKRYGIDFNLERVRLLAEDNNEVNSFCLICGMGIEADHGKCHIIAMERLKQPCKHDNIRITEGGLRQCNECGAILFTKKGEYD